MNIKENPLPKPSISHDTRYLKQRIDEWALQVAGFEAGTPHHLILKYKVAFDAQTDAGRSLAIYQDELEAKAQQQQSAQL